MQKRQLIGEIYKYKEYSFGWYIRYFDDTPMLYIIDKPEVEIKGCNNPWNIVHYLEPEPGKEILRNELLKIKPEKNIIHNHGDGTNKPLLQTKIFTIEEFHNDIDDFIEADCWGYYSINKDRSISKVYYYNNMHDKIGNRDYSLNKEHILNELKSGKTIFVVLGCSNFIDVYYQLNDDKIVCSILEYEMLKIKDV